MIFSKLPTLSRVSVAASLGALLWFGPTRTAEAQLFERTDTQKEVELGRQAAREVEKEMPLSTNRAFQERGQRIGQALVDTLPEKPYSFQFKVLALPDVNAFALPGGPVYIFEGLLTKMPDDNEVAFVLGHELTHAVNRHWAKHTNKMQGVGALAIVAAIATGNSSVPDLVQQLLSLQYSRDQEAEADRVGMELMWKAGFSPQGSVDAMQVLAKLDGGKEPPVWLSNHPGTKDRVKRLMAERDDLKNRPRPVVVNPASAQAARLNLDSVLGTAPPPASGSNPWMPLAVGNEWTYAVGTESGAPQYTLRVVGEIKGSTRTAYRAETVLAGQPGVPCQLLTTANRLYRRDRLSDARSPWKQEFAFEPPPPTVGAPAAGDTVSVPCGVFTDVLRLRTTGPSGQYDVWFARNVGMIRRTNRETGVTENLVRYRMAAGAPKTAAAPGTTAPPN